MGAIASQITSLTIVYSNVYSDADQRKHQSSASLAFVWGIHRGPVNSPHKWPATRKMSPFDDVIMITSHLTFVWNQDLTHWGRDKMVAIFQTTFSNAFCLMKMYEFRLRFYWNVVPMGPVINIPALLQRMAWRLIGDKPLSEPKVTQFNDAYMRHPATMRW